MTKYFVSKFGDHEASCFAQGLHYDGFRQEVVALARGSTGSFLERKTSFFGSFCLNNFCICIQYIYIYVYCVYIYIYTCVCVYVCLVVCLFIYLFIYLWIYLCISSSLIFIAPETGSRHRRSTKAFYCGEKTGGEYEILRACCFNYFQKHLPTETLGMVNTTFIFFLVNFVRTFLPFAKVSMWRC